jgi:carboxymethylenebutenolidase
MCYDDNARPPMPPGANGKATGEDVVLTAEDGNRFAVYAAQPEGSTGMGAQVLIFPDVRGLHGFYKDLALRFADVGIRAVAMDYFGRTAGLTARDDSFDFWPHVQQLQAPTMQADIRATLEYMRQGEGAQRATFTLGFCMGGSVSFLTGTQPLGLAGVIGFYAGLMRQFPGFKGNVIEEAKGMKCPVLGLFGGADQNILPENVQDFTQSLLDAKVPNEIVTYPGAPHSFFDRKATEFAEASADAWNRVLGFIAANTTK